MLRSSTYNCHDASYFLRIVLCVFFSAFLICVIVRAQTRSRISGIVKDAQTGESLIGTNVIVLGTNLGASTDFDGQYIIINVPVGTWKLQASMIGYAKATVVNVVVSSDRITTVDFLMQSENVQTEEVIVTAERNQLHKEVSNTQLVITDDQLLSTAGVREINTFLESQPGIEKENGFLTIRGGAADQTGTMVNGMMFNNAAVGNAETSIPLSAVEQISLLSGGYNAEYGNFRSGLINVVTKSGTKDGYHGAINVSRNLAHMKRFGPKFNDTKGPFLQPFLDPDIAFIGSAAAWANDPYTLQQHETSIGWNAAAESYNSGKSDKDKVTPLDLYLFASWMHMAVPDYEGLDRQYTTNLQGNYILDGNGHKIKLLDYWFAQSAQWRGKTADELRQLYESQKKLFEKHALNEEGVDYNIDFGFGGPFPFVGEFLGDATFYISHNRKETNYIMPVTRNSDVSNVTLATIKSNPLADLTVTVNGLYKHQLGISPIRPPFGDFPDATRDGGFMQEDNLKKFVRLTDGNYGQLWDMSLYPELIEDTYMGSITINHLITKSTFWELTLGYLTMRDDAPTGDTRDQTAITHFGPIVVSEMPYGKYQYAGSSTGSGSDKLTLIDGLDTLNYNHASYDAVLGLPAYRRFRGKEGDLYTKVQTQQYRSKFDISSQSRQQ